MTPSEMLNMLSTSDDKLESAMNILAELVKENAVRKTPLVTFEKATNDRNLDTICKQFEAYGFNIYKNNTVAIAVAKNLWENREITKYIQYLQKKHKDDTVSSYFNYSDSCVVIIGKEFIINKERIILDSDKLADKSRITVLLKDIDISKLSEVSIQAPYKLGILGVDFSNINKIRELVSLRSVSYIRFLKCKNNKNNGIDITNSITTLAKQRISIDLRGLGKVYWNPIEHNIVNYNWIDYNLLDKSMNSTRFMLAIDELQMGIHDEVMEAYAKYIDNTLHSDFYGTRILSDTEIFKSLIINKVDKSRLYEACEIKLAKTLRIGIDSYVKSKLNHKEYEELRTYIVDGADTSFVDASIHQYENFPLNIKYVDRLKTNEYVETIMDGIDVSDRAKVKRW